MPKFTIEEHNRRMQEIRDRVRRPQLMQRPDVLQRLKERARLRRGL